MFRVVMVVLVLVGALLAPLATPSVATASVSTTESAPFPWGSATPVFAQGHALWPENGQLWDSQWTGQGWDIPVRVATVDDLSPRGVKPNYQGGLEVVFSVWLESLQPASEIYHVSWSTDAGWTLPALVSRTSYESSRAAIFVQPDGLLHAVWQDWQPWFGEAGAWWIRYGQFSPLQVAQAATMQSPASPMVSEPETVASGYGLWTSVPIPSGRGVEPDIWVTPDGWEIFVAWTDEVTPFEGGEPQTDVFVAGKLLWLPPAEQWSSAWNVSDSPENSVLARVTGNFSGWGARVYWNEHENGEWWSSIWFDDLGQASMSDRWKLNQVFLPSVGR